MEEEMYCQQCDGIYKSTTEQVTIEDPYVGPITLQGIPFYKCDRCNDTLYSLEFSRALDAARANKIESFIRKFSIGDFINAAETASYLHVSRQALHKNHRISRGFIYHIKLDGITYYLKQSVELYKQTGDGRFPLHISVTAPSDLYYPQVVPSRLIKRNYGRVIMENRKQKFTDELISSREQSYAN